MSDLRSLQWNKDVLRKKQDEFIRDKRNLIRKEIMKRLSELSEVSEEEIFSIIDECIQYESKKYTLSVTQKTVLRNQLFHSIRRLDVIQDYLDDDAVTEIMVNGIHEIFIEKDGKIIKTSAVFESRERLMDIVQMIASDANRTINLSSPIVDARLKDGSRVNIVLDPVALNGPVLTIRRFPSEPIKAATLIKLESISEECMDFLTTLVKAKYNMLICGGTGSGKTTLMNVLSGFIPKDERIITIEDSAELQIQGIENLVRLESRNANMSSGSEITIRDLIKSALRMRPDRIIVGEVRGEEAIDMLQAFNVGEDGSMSTIHANSAGDAIYRLETMIMMNSEIPLAALRRQIASGVDIVVYLSRLRDKSRRLVEIIEVLGMRDNEILTQVLYSFEEESEENGRIVGRCERRNRLSSEDKLIKAGYGNEL